MARDAEVVLQRCLETLATHPLNEEAWVDFHRATRPFIIGVVFRYMRNADAALVKDVTQEVYFALLRYTDFSKLTDTTALRAYLSTVAKRTALNYRGSKPFRDRVEVGDVAESDLAVEPAASMSEVREVLATEIGRLSADERSLIALIIRGKSLREIGASFGISGNAAGVRVARLRQKLRSSPLHAYLRGSR